VSSFPTDWSAPNGRAIGVEPPSVSRSGLDGSAARPTPSARAAGPGPVAVSVVSNSVLQREALVSLLASHIEIRLIGSYDGSSQPVEHLSNPPGHVVLLDTGVGPEAGLAWTRGWRSLTQPPHVIALELADDSDTILAYIGAGAGGYTLKGASANQVAQAIVWVRQGIAQCSPRVAADLFHRYAAVESTRGQPHTRLTPPLTLRELEVLRHVNADRSNQEIAALLVVEVRTVKHHVHNILQKLKLRHRWDAARLATQQGWLEPIANAPSEGEVALSSSSE
jgi:two-component system nitrate/nitrite response regulator NarL